MADDAKDPNNPPTLSDVLAALVTSVSRARVQADLSSVEVARLYQQHELLRAMPIPRLRVNRVQVSVPLIVTAVRPGERFQLKQESEDGETGRQIALDVARSIRVIREGLMLDAWTALGKTVDPPVNDRPLLKSSRRTSDRILDPNSELGRLLEGLYDTLDDALDQLESKIQPDDYANAIGFALAAYRGRSPNQDPASDLAIHAACKAAVERVLKRRLDLHRGAQRRIVEELDAKRERSEAEEQALRRADRERFHALLMGEKEPSEQVRSSLAGGFVRSLYDHVLVAIPELIQGVGERAGHGAFARPPRAPEVEISVNTAQVKNEGTPTSVTRIQMVMSEEGLEWVAESTDGGEPQWKLVPE